MRHLDEPAIRSAMRDRIRDRIDPVADGDPTAVLDAVIRWYWQERTPKFLMRHPAEFEYWGYDRALPLWDRELARFWSSVPHELRRGKKLYEEFVARLNREYFESPCRFAGEDASDSEGNALSTLEAAVSHFPFESEIRKLYRQWQARSVKRSEKYLQYGFLSAEQFERLHPRVRHVKYYQALDKLSRIDCEPVPGSPFSEDLRLYETL